MSTIQLSPAFHQLMISATSGWLVGGEPICDTSSAFVDLAVDPAEAAYRCETVWGIRTRLDALRELHHRTNAAAVVRRSDAEGAFLIDHPFVTAWSNPEQDPLCQAASNLAVALPALLTPRQLELARLVQAADVALAAGSAGILSTQETIGFLHHIHGRIRRITADRAEVRAAVKLLDVCNILFRWGNCSTGEAESIRALAAAVQTESDTAAASEKLQTLLRRDAGWPENPWDRAWLEPLAEPPTLDALPAPVADEMTDQNAPSIAGLKIRGSSPMSDFDRACAMTHRRQANERSALYASCGAALLIVPALIGGFLRVDAGVSWALLVAFSLQYAPLAAALFVSSRRYVGLAARLSAGAHGGVLDHYQGELVSPSGLCGPVLQLTRADGAGPMPGDEMSASMLRDSGALVLINNRHVNGLVAPINPVRLSNELGTLGELNRLHAQPDWDHGDFRLRRFTDAERREIWLRCWRMHEEISPARWTLLCAAMVSGGTALVTLAEFEGSLIAPIAILVSMISSAAVVLAGWSECWQCVRDLAVNEVACIKQPSRKKGSPIFLEYTVGSASPWSADGGPAMWRLD